MSNDKKEPIDISRLVQAQIGTSQQSNLIEEHLKEYFTRFASYKDKFTYLEWYHIFLDFLDKVPSPKAGDTPKKVFRWWKADLGPGNGFMLPGTQEDVIGMGYDNPEEMITDAYKKFPKVMNRQSRPIRIDHHTIKN